MPWSIALPVTTMPSERLIGTAERRLHPLSWLFVLIASVREFAVPLVAALVLGSRSDSAWELFGLIGGGVLALHAVLAYYTYRFRIEDEQLMVRSGIVMRTLRHIPFRRIHNVTLHQSILHRLFGVAEVRLESAGGVTPEAHMRVLRLDDAQALEALVRQSRSRTAAASEPAEASDAPPLLCLDTAELVRLGLISNRGMVLVAAAVGVMAQSGSDLFGTLINALAEPVIGWASSNGSGPLVWVVGAVLLFGVFAIALRVLSVMLAVLQFHGFTLRQDDDRLSVDAGLLTRIRANAPLHRIQSWHRNESLLHRWFGRQSLTVDTAGVAAINQGRSLRELVPVATSERIDRLLANWLPGIDWQDAAWHPIHPRAWRRMAVAPILLTVAIASGVALLHGAIALWFGLLLPWWLFRARKLAGNLRYSIQDGVLLIRSGWLNRHWRFAEIAKLQALRLSESPLDRRAGMATLYFDTAGASSNPMAPTLHIPYLPHTEARRLLIDLSQQIASTRLRW